MIFSLFLLFLFLFLGESLKSLFELQFPGPVLGMILLLFFLCLYPKDRSHWSIAADLILKNLAILFVPAGVGLMSYGWIIYQDLGGLILVFLLGTILIVIASALFIQNLGRGK